MFRNTNRLDIPVLCWRGDCGLLPVGEDGGDLVRVGGGHGAGRLHAVQVDYGGVAPAMSPHSGGDNNIYTGHYLDILSIAKSP